MSNATRVAKYGYRRVITKVLVSAAIVVGSWVGEAAPAGAEPDAIGAESNPYTGFRCSCPQAAPPGSPAASEEINRGLRQGHSAWLPGLPAPTQPR
jgi:hypothetical protein